MTKRFLDKNKAILMGAEWLENCNYEPVFISSPFDEPIQIEDINSSQYDTVFIPNLADADFKLIDAGDWGTCHNWGGFISNDSLMVYHFSDTINEQCVCGCDATGYVAHKEEMVYYCENVFEDGEQLRTLIASIACPNIGPVDTLSHNRRLKLTCAFVYKRRHCLY